MTNNEAARWIQLYIGLAKFDPSTGEEAYLNEDDRKTLEAMEIARDALICMDDKKMHDTDDLISRQPKHTAERTETRACDLVDRSAAITAIQKAYADTEGGEDKCAVWNNVGLTNALHIMQDLPSAQQEIVRCKDCKYWREGTVYLYCDKLFGMGVLDAYDYMTDEDDYCSMAERRADDGE